VKHGEDESPWLFTLACWLPALLISAPCIAADGVDKSAVKLRVDDYAPVAAALLSRSQEEVTQLYAAVGVETTRLKTRSFASRPSAAPPALGRRRAGRDPHNA
jgi:hypothetical protein